MRVTTKGQVTIPQEIREAMGFLPHTEVRFVRKGNAVYIEKLEGKAKRGHRLIERMRGTATVKMSTDEIMALTRGRS